MQKYQILIGIMAVLFVIMAIPLVIVGAVSIFSSDIHSSDIRFDGIRQTLDNGKNVHLVVIHGIGTHCLGYSQQLVNGILVKVGIKPDKEDVVDCTELLGKLRDDATAYDHAELCKKTKGCEIIELVQQVPPGNTNLNNCSNYNQARKELEQVGNIGSEERCIIKTTIGFLWTREYDDRKTGNSFRIYEVTWDPATRWFKTNYVDGTDRFYEGERNIINGRIKKDLVNQSMADAVLYLGGYRPVMQYPLLMTFCKVVSSGTPTGSVKEKELNTQGHIIPRFFVCNPADIEERTESFEKNNEIAVITHSLGTRMLFDVLGFIGNNVEGIFKKTIDSLNIPIDVVFNDANLEAMASSSQVLQTIFLKSINKIFTFANQIPLLELGMVKSPVDTVKMRAEQEGKRKVNLGTRFEEFIAKRRELPEIDALQVVSFTDNNDLLSYNLKCWYYMNVLRYEEHIKSVSREFTADEREHDPRFSCHREATATFWEVAGKYIKFADVTIYLSEFVIPWLYAEPVSAHSGYFEENAVYELVACGSKRGERINDCDKGSSTNL